MKKIALFAVLVSLASFGDINTAEELLKEWETKAEASLLLTSGNTEVTTVGLGAGTTYSPDPWKFKAQGNFLTSKATGIKTAESYDALLRGQRVISDDLSGFLQMSYLKNEFTGFRERYGAEAGVAYRLLFQNNHTLSSEIGFGYLKELLITGPAGNPLGDRSFATGRVALDYRWKFSPSAELSENVSFLDNLGTMSDWRFSSNTALTAIMTQTLSLRVSFKVDYLNNPVPGKKNTDTSTMVALVAIF